MTQEEYFEFHLQTIWKVYQKLNADLYTHKEKGSVYEQIYNHNKEGFKIIENYEEFYESVMKHKNGYAIDPDYFQIKSSLFQTFRNFNKEEFLKEFIDEIIFNSPEDYSTAFIENRFKYPMNQGTMEYLKELLPKMSYENALCYFSQINNWFALHHSVSLEIPRLKDLPYCKELIYTSAKICCEKDSQNINSYEYSHVINYLLDNYSDKELKTFDFLSDINNFLNSKNKPKDVILNQDDIFFTTKISIDCEHAKNIYYYKGCNSDHYAALVNELMKHLKDDPIYNILDVNIIHKYDEDQFGRNKIYKISEVFIDTKEYEPNLKQKVSYLINEYIKDYIDTLKNNIDGFDSEKFTKNWLMQESLKSELTVNDTVTKKTKKL